MILNPYEKIKEVKEDASAVHTSKTKTILEGKQPGDTTNRNAKETEDETNGKESNLIKDEHGKDKEFISFDKLKMVGSLSEYSTMMLNAKLKKIEKIKAEDRLIIIVKDKKSADMVPIIRSNNNDAKITVLHTNNKHLPMYDRSMEDYCEANSITIVSSIDELISVVEAW